MPILNKMLPDSKSQYTLIFKSMAEDQPPLNLPVAAADNSANFAANPPQWFLDIVALIFKGEHKAAAELLIADYMKRLPAGHPSKEGSSGVMMGEAVSKFSHVEDQKHKMYETTRFIVMMRAFDKLPVDFEKGVSSYLLEQRPDLVTGFTEYMEQVLENRVRVAAGEEAIPPSQSPRPI